MRGSKNGIGAVDYTNGSVMGHLLRSCPAIFLGIVSQSLCLLVDTYCVSYFSAQDVAAVSSVFTIFLLTSMFSQILSSGGIACLSPVIGRKDEAGFRRAAADALSLSLIMTVVYLALIVLCSGHYLRTIAADNHVNAIAENYLLYFLPALVLPLPIAAMSASFRASGVLSAPVGALLAMIGINIVLAPCLTFGWFGGYSFGVVGTALASSFSSIIGLMILLAFYVSKINPFGSFINIPSKIIIVSIVRTGLPASGEIFIMFIISTIIYFLIGPYGADAQAGLGIGSRVVQLAFWPALSGAFATAPIVGQNHGIKHKGNIIKSINCGITITCILMTLVTALVFFNGGIITGVISKNSNINNYATIYEKIKCFCFVPLGISMVASNVLQALERSALSFNAAVFQMFLFCALIAFDHALYGLSFKSVSNAEMCSYIFQAILSLHLLRSAIRRLAY